MRRLFTLVSVLSLAMMLQPSATAVVTSSTSPMCQPTSTTPDIKESRRVQAVLVIGDTVYMGGRFDRVMPPGGGAPVIRNHIVACSLSTGAILPWNPDASGANNLKGSVFALATDGTRLYAGGAFDAVGGQQAIGLVALDPNPMVDSPKPLLWGGGPGPGSFTSGSVKALALSDDRRTLYAGGNFSTFGFPGSREPRIGLAAVSTVDGTLSSWAPKLISETQQTPCPPDDPTCVVGPSREVEVRSIVVRGDKVVAGGFFTEQSLVDRLGSSYNGEGHVAAFDATTGASVSWNFKPRYAVLSLSADADRVYVGGGGKGVSQNVVTAAAWTDGSVKWTNYADGNWQALWAGHGVVYGAGHMRRCGPKKNVQNDPEPTTERLCAFEPATGKLLDWAPTTQSVGELGVFGLHGTPDALVAVGEFSKVNGADQRGAVRFGGPQGASPGNPGTPGNPPPGLAPSGGYRLVATDGGIFAFGDAPFFGSTGNIRLNQPIVGMTSTTSGRGYWLVASDGGIFAFGDARFQGSTGNLRLNRPIVGMATSPSGGGYWLVASDGGIFAFGDAGFFGSTGALRLNQPIVGMTSTPSGRGYWLVASDGGIFAFGDARFQGSTGNIRLAKPITAMTATRSGNGYWMTATDGGIFAFGDATFFGSKGGQPLAKPIVAMSTSKTGNGYWMVGGDGAVFNFGDAPNLGSLAGRPLARPIVGMAAL